MSRPERKTAEQRTFAKPASSSSGVVPTGRYVGFAAGSPATIAITATPNISTATTDLRFLIASVPLSAELDELRQAPKPGRRGWIVPVSVAPVRERDLADVDVAVRVDREAVRRRELARLEPRRPVAESRQQIALRPVDA